MATSSNYRCGYFFPSHFIWAITTCKSLSAATLNSSFPATQSNGSKRTHWIPVNYEQLGADRVILFDFTDKWVYVVEIKGTTTTPVRTPEGHYFAAYKRVSSIARRKLTKTRWKLFKDAGIITNQADAQRRRKLTKTRYEDCVALQKTL